jgi:hypothetical protein
MAVVALMITIHHNSHLDPDRFVETFKGDVLEELSEDRLGNIADRDLSRIMAMREFFARKKNELLGTDPTPVESLIVDLIMLDLHGLLEVETQLARMTNGTSIDTARFGLVLPGIESR